MKPGEFGMWKPFTIILCFIWLLLFGILLSDAAIPVKVVLPLQASLSSAKMERSAKLAFVEPLREGISHMKGDISEKVAATSAKVENYFFERGVTDIKRAVLIHEVLGMSMLFGTWTVCYFYPPSQTKLLKEPISRTMKMFPSAMSRSFEFGKFGGSYIEASCLRKIVRPVMIPTKLWSTFMIIRLISPQTQTME